MRRCPICDAVSEVVYLDACPACQRVIDSTIDDFSEEGNLEPQPDDDEGRIPVVKALIPQGDVDE